MNISDAARELLPCPFCGSEKVGLSYVSNTGGNVCYYACNKCSAHGPWSNHHVARDNWNTRDTTATAALTLELETVKRDMQDAAGELMVPMPEPGTIEAKMMSANVLMRHERDQLRQQLAEAREWMQSAYTVIERGVDLVTVDQLGQWESVRITLETCPMEVTLNPPTDEK